MSRYSFIALLALLAAASLEAAPSSPADAPVVKASQAAADTSSEAKDEDEGSSPEDVHRIGVGQVVSIGHDAVLGKDDRAEEVVAVFGSATSDGEVRGEVLSVFGETHVSGHVGGESVAVFGSNYINGKVDGQAVSVLGDVVLGPQADVSGDVVVVGGELRRSPGAVIHGDVQGIAGFLSGDAHRLGRWLHDCFLYGRVLGLSPDLRWAWGLALGFLALYALLALVFQEPFERCLQTLETRPGHSFLAGLFTLLLTPLLFILLVITLIGVLAVPPIGAALVCACLFGKVVVLGWLGRHCLGALHATQAPAHPAVAVLVGGAIVLALYTVPVVGMIVFNLLGVFALGTVVYTLVLLTQRTTAARVSPIAPSAAQPAAAVPPPPQDHAGAAPPPPEAAPPNTGATAADGVAPAAAAPAAPAPVPLTWPRAGFWIRMGALFIDVVLVSIVWSLVRDHDGYHHHSFPLLLLAGYGAVMWKLKGTTVGGLVCNLRVIRHDGRELDWSTAIVRALSCFLSLLLAGLGFFWIAFDHEHQAWHDKIAGTLVVRVPQGQQHTAHA